jgi:PncC family amidohydrolase
MYLVSNKIIKKLLKKKFTISFVESCTGGMLSSVITSVPGSSKVFNLGLVTYSNKAKINVLKVSKEIINNYGAVSKECCKDMVKKLSKISKSKLCLSITGIAGPNGGSKKKPVGLVFIGIKKRSKISINKYIFKNKGRKIIQKAAVKKSLNLILHNLK